MSSDDERPLPTASTAARLRKRSRVSRASTNSSDPVYFSSDDLADASLDNYTSPRRKMLYKRKWWQDDDTTAPLRHDALRRASKRAKDSGVFMSSDSSSNSSTDDGLSVASIAAKNSQAPANKFSLSWKSPATPSARSNLNGEFHARQAVAACLEDEKEAVDLR